MACSTPPSLRAWRPPGIHFSLSDVAVGCALGYLDFRFPVISWRNDYPNLAKLSEKLALRQSFIDSKPA